LTKADIVTVMSLGVVGLSALLMLLVWRATDFLEPFWHGIISLAAWVAGFAIGCVLLWRGVARLSNNKGAKI
jgi:membrane associated rhomboid family serine protease